MLALTCGAVVEGAIGVRKLIEFGIKIRRNRKPQVARIRRKADGIALSNFDVETWLHWSPSHVRPARDDLVSRSRVRSREVSICVLIQLLPAR